MKLDYGMLLILSIVFFFFLLYAIDWCKNGWSYFKSRKMWKGTGFKIENGKMYVHDLGKDPRQGEPILQDKV